MEPTPPFKELLPGNQAHKDFISTALITRNFAQLASLKNRTDKTIHLVSNWFYYSIMKIDCKQDIVVIYSTDDKATIDRISNNEKED